VVIVGNWSLNRKLFVAFGLLLSFVLVIGTIGWMAAASMGARQDDSVQSASRLLIVDDIKQINTEIFGAEKTMILSGVAGDKKSLQVWTEKLQKLVEDGKKSADQLVAASAGDELAKAIELKKSMAAWEGRCDACHAVAIGADLRKEIDKVLQVSADSEAVANKNRQIADTIRASHQATFKLDAERADATYNQARVTIAAVSVPALLIGVAALIVVSRVSKRLASAAARLRQASDAVTAESSQVSASAQSLSQGATEQAASLEETSASMEEMSSTTRTNADHTHKAATLMNEVDQKVTDSDRALNTMVESIASIRQSSQQVSKIIKTIDEIAFQTNLLALNAAVEAARAGEAGMGFAVVADEVRNLARRSAEAAKDTAELIETSIRRSEEGARNVDQVVAAITGIAETVRQVKDIANQVSDASRQQAQGIQQVATAITQMESVTQTTAATAEENAAAAVELTSQAETTMELVGLLEETVNGTRATGRPHQSRGARGDHASSTGAMPLAA
jgi:methyl-accepting chemotaxis protein/methyl-accepting chemotaxis protein-1 (serine sensor receptor)